MLVRRLLFLFLAWFMDVAAAELRVTVQDPEKKAVVDVTVVLTENGREEYSDRSGQARFRDLAGGEWTVVVVAPGYQKKEERVRVGDGTTAVTLTLRPVTLKAREIVISAKRHQGEVVSSNTVNNQEMRRTSQTFLNDAVKTLQTLPGVSSSGTSFDSRMYIQGGEPVRMDRVAGRRRRVDADPLGWKHFDVQPGDDRNDRPLHRRLPGQLGAGNVRHDHG